MPPTKFFPESACELLRDAMEGLVDELGDRNNLTEAIDAVIPWRESLRVREHPFSGDFSVVETTDRDASVYSVALVRQEERELVDTGVESRYGTYFSTLFRFTVGPEREAS